MKSAPAIHDPHEWPAVKEAARRSVFAFVPSPHSIKANSDSPHFKVTTWDTDLLDRKGEVIGLEHHRVVSPLNEGNRAQRRSKR